MKVVMKVGVLFLVFAFFAGVQASDREDKKLKSVMHSFSSALELIQHGVLYNKMDEMYKGVQLLERNEQKFMQRHGDALKEHLPNNPKFAYDYAKSTSKRIVKLTKRLSTSLGGSKDFSDIAAVYGHIVQECVGCHQKLRRR